MRNVYSLHNIISWILISHFVVLQTKAVAGDGGVWFVEFYGPDCSKFFRIRMNEFMHWLLSTGRIYMLSLLLLLLLMPAMMMIDACDDDATNSCHILCGV